MSARWLAALAVLAGLAVWFYPKLVPEKTTPATEFIEGTGDAPANAMPESSPAPSLTAAPSPQPSASPAAVPGATPSGATNTKAPSDTALGPPPALRPVREATPSLAKLRDEVDKNSHGTPPSLMRFSDEVGERVAQVRNERQASDLFVELEDCLTKPKDKNAHSVQAVCLINARDLSQKYESLREPYRALVKKSNPTVVKLVKDVP
ncbi:MAG TPA: hypothetical protein VFV50_05095 [Bdellovibrionales bacterium]|nr:hypothetical protein [Bdellovibrionales bacterium]